KDTTVWIRYDFEKESRVSACSVYWFDDGPQGGCRIPQSWQILYRSGDAWIPVETKGNYPVVKDQLNKIRFSPVTTTSLKLEVRLQKEFSSGIYEWKVEE
ncbi:MAG TPA: glycoside hydrolase family 127 protein, partial [Bacteroidales bacterium]|nr:glycoside hydrolase family 127 protein [Bacteroidales bacterium]